MLPGLVLALSLAAMIPTGTLWLWVRAGAALGTALILPASPFPAGVGNSTDGITYPLVPTDPSEQIYPMVFNPPVDRTDLNNCYLAAPTICLTRLYESLLDTPDNIQSVCQVPFPTKECAR